MGSSTKNRDVITKAVLETLEDRKLLSAATYADGVLTIWGNPNSPNQLSVQLSADGKVWGASNNVKRSVHLNRVQSIRIIGGAEADKITVDSNLKIPVTIDAKEGNDTIWGGGGDDTIYAGAGRDWVNGNGGNDLIRGGDDNDTLIGGDGFDEIDGGGGINVITGDDDSVPTDDTSNPIDGGTTPTEPIPTETPTDGGTTPTEPIPTETPTDGGTTPTDPAPPPTDSVGGGDTSVTPHPDAPLPIIRALSQSVMAGAAIHVHGTDTQLKAGTALTARYEWDFGDSDGSYNTLIGWNAAHVYDKPGTYTVTLRVTDELGRSSTASINVQIAPDTRRAIYVSAAGNDAADGLSPDRAVRSVARVNQLLGDDTKVLFRRGDTFDVSFQLSIPYKNVLVGAYGTGANPRLRRIADDSSRALINTNATTSRDVTIQDLTLDSQWTSTDGEKIPFNAIWARGSNITVRRNTFLNVNYGVDASSAPTGLLVQDNSAPLVTGIRGYFLWLQGSDAVVLGNTVANTTREMVLRAVDYQRVLVAHNDFTDLNRTHLDSKDLANSNLALQQGSWAYVRANRFSTAGVGFGPGTTPTSLPEQRSIWGVFEANRLEDSMLRLAAGAEHSFVRNNVSTISSGPAFFVEGYSTEYSRDVVDATFAHNTASVSGSVGGFLRLWGEARQITVVNNLLLAPNLSASISGAIVSYDPDLSSFKLIDSNVWSMPDSYADKVSYVWTGWFDLRGRVSAEQWNLLAPVGTDLFVKDVTLTEGGYQFTTGQTVVGAEPLPAGLA